MLPIMCKINSGKSLFLKKSLLTLCTPKRYNKNQHFQQQAAALHTIYLYVTTKG